MSSRPDDVANMLSGPPRLVPFVFIFILLCAAWYLHYLPGSGTKTSSTSPYSRPSSLRGDPLDFSIPLRFSDGKPKAPGSNYTYKIVIPKTKKEDLTWLQIELPDAPLMVYEVDNPNAVNKVPKNKGREAMVCTPGPRPRFWDGN